jgi:uncharacterized protein YfaS (alpha-2-macroglobulin family)
METNAAFGETVDSPNGSPLAGVLPGAGGLNIEMASTALVGLGEGARYLAEYQFACGEQKASAALALVLAADLGNVQHGRIAPADYRKRATQPLNDPQRHNVWTAASATGPAASGATSISRATCCT